MKVSVYLPDEMGQKAKDLGLPFSQLLRRAVEYEMQEFCFTQAALNEGGGVAEYKLDLVDGDGNSYVGKLTGKLVWQIDEIAVYLTEDVRIIVYNKGERRYTEIDDVEEAQAFFENAVPKADFVVLMNKLGGRAEVEL